jgi:hypothetical protein
MAAAKGEVSRDRIIKLIVRPYNRLKRHSGNAAIEDAGTLSCTAGTSSRETDEREVAANDGSIAKAVR